MELCLFFRGFRYTFALQITLNIFDLGEEFIH